MDRYLVFSDLKTIPLLRDPYFTSFYQISRKQFSHNYKKVCYHNALCSENENICLHSLRIYHVQAKP